MKISQPLPPEIPNPVASEHSQSPSIYNIHRLTAPEISLILKIPNPQKLAPENLQLFISCKIPIYNTDKFPTQRPLKPPHYSS